MVPYYIKALSQVLYSMEGLLKIFPSLKLLSNAFSPIEDLLKRLLLLEIFQMASIFQMSFILYNTFSGSNHSLKPLSYSSPLKISRLQ